MGASLNMNSIVSVIVISSSLTAPCKGPWGASRVPPGVVGSDLIAAATGSVERRKTPSAAEPAALGLGLTVGYSAVGFGVLFTGEDDEDDSGSGIAANKLLQYRHKDETDNTVGLHRGRGGAGRRVMSERAR